MFNFLKKCKHKYIHASGYQYCMRCGEAKLTPCKHNFEKTETGLICLNCGLKIKYDCKHDFKLIKEIDFPAEQGRLKRGNICIFQCQICGDINKIECLAW